MNQEVKRTTIFHVSVVFNNSNGAIESREFKKINHAVRYLWKKRNVAEGYLTIVEIYEDGSVSKHKLLAKVGRRRGICGGLTRQTADTQARPLLKKAGEGWYRLPNRFNDIK